jgi:hypothetical protein
MVSPDNKWQGSQTAGMKTESPATSPRAYPLSHWVPLSALRTMPTLAQGLPPQHVCHPAHPLKRTIYCPAYLLKHSAAVAVGKGAGHPVPVRCVDADLRGVRDEQT